MYQFWELVFSTPHKIEMKDKSVRGGALLCSLTKKMSLIVFFKRGLYFWSEKTPPAKRHSGFDLNFNENKCWCKCSHFKFNLKKSYENGIRYPWICLAIFTSGLVRFRCAASRAGFFRLKGSKKLMLRGYCHHTVVINSKLAELFTQFDETRLALKKQLPVSSAA